MRTHPLAMLVAATLVVGSAVPAAAADPVELTVTTTADVTDAGDGLTSLREAVEEADAAAGGYVIHLPPGTYRLDAALGVDGTDAEVVLRGAGRGETTIDAQGTGRVLWLEHARMRLQDLAVTGGEVVDSSAGAIAVGNSELYLERVRVHDNTVRAVALAAGFVGGAVSVRGSGGGRSHLEITDSEFRGNTVVAESDVASVLYGGAVYVSGDSTFAILDSRFHGNAVVAHSTSQGVTGGAIAVSNLLDRSSFIHGSTFDANDLVLPPGHTGWAQGAALNFNDNNGDGVAHEIRTSNLTIDGNGDSAPEAASVYADHGPLVVGFEHLTLRSDGAGMSMGSNVVELANSVIDTAGSACTGADAVSQGGNVVSDDTCGAGGPTDAMDTDPGLGAFDATTSPVPVVRLAADSPALDHGVLDEIEQDARWLPRPAGPAPDSGAFEHQGPVAVDDVAATSEDTPVAIPVTVNDAPGDAGLAPGSVSVVAGPAHGTATPAPNGTITFTPTRSGGTSFDYRVCQDGFARCDTATVTVTVAPADDPTGPPDPADPTEDPGEQGVVRRAGQDRYETAVLASRAAFDPGVAVAYVATGEAFPDALAGAPLAARDDAPILLTRPDELPATTAAELDRLSPGRIVVLGGTAAVSAGVEQALAGLTTGTVSRLHGPDRYATAARIAEAFTRPGGTVYLATALNFPDALAGAAAAGRDGAPILLVAPSQLPTTTAAQLARLDPAEVVVLGGSGVVADPVLAAVEELLGTMPTRLSGDDRYATASAVSATFDAADTVYLATGLSFPDALAAAPIAGAEPAPILLTPPDALPDAAVAELERLSPDRVVVLGGEGAVSTAVADAVAVTLP